VKIKQSTRHVPQGHCRLIYSQLSEVACQNSKTFPFIIVHSLIILIRRGLNLKNSSDIQKTSRSHFTLQVGRWSGASALKLDLVSGKGAKKADRAGLNIDRANLCAVMLEKLLERHGESGLLDVHFFKRCAGQGGTCAATFIPRSGIIFRSGVRTRKFGREA
jgi:hypothetical protein